MMISINHIHKFLFSMKEEAKILSRITRAAVAHFLNGTHILKFEFEFLNSLETENVVFNVTAVWCQATTAFCLVSYLLL